MCYISKAYIYNNMIHTLSSSYVVNIHAPASALREAAPRPGRPAPPAALLPLPATSKSHSSDLH